MTTDLTHALHQAAADGDLPQLSTLIQTGVDVNLCNRQGRTAILIAAMHQQYAAIDYLIGLGADINQQDETCLNPFLWGCLHDDLILVRQMVQAGADLTRLTRFGGVGLTPAAEKGYVAIVRELLTTTHINRNHTNFVGWTPLLEAIVLNDGGPAAQAVVNLLLAHGADPNMTDKYGKTPLCLAQEKGYAAIADLLRVHGG